MPAHNHTAHAHAQKKFGLPFAVGAILNFGLVVAQFLYGIHAHSIALIADDRRPRLKIPSARS